MRAEFSNEEFVGYSFQGAPERRPRLWFLDRQLHTLIVWGTLCTARKPDEVPSPEGSFQTAGEWTVDVTREAARFAAEHYDPKTGRRWQEMFTPDEVIQKVMPGCDVRYEDRVGKWVAVWRLTDLIIPHVETFGYDDTWRLGLWPD